MCVNFTLLSINFFVIYRNIYQCAIWLIQASVIFLASTKMENQMSLICFCLITSGYIYTENYTN